MDFPGPFYRWRPHPWHGLEVGDNPPELVHAYIEITPFDYVKYELEKETGYLKVDRPQRTSSQPPALYGFIPRTFCGQRVNKLMKTSKRGDGDPLDIVVISERPINKSEVILNTRVIGGLAMIDGDEADDKIIGILENDNIYGGINDISELPKALTDRINHYFLTYKHFHGQKNQVAINRVYGQAHAKKVVQAAMDDYKDVFGP
jgi:inorganic pyrophosphatase